ncbi:MAG: tyrosine-type recombinase/integrase, partial [Bacilli bacterium]|nr:tyrosine-type recombinase/integrase [Bacilli bacterium]
MLILIKDYINYIYIEKKLSLNTKNAYEHDLMNFRQFLHEKRHKNNINDITEQDIIFYLEDLTKQGISPNSRTRHIISIKNFYKYLSREKLCTHNPSENIETPKLKKKLPQVLTIEEITKLLNWQPTNNYEYRNKAMLELMYATGLRVTELVNLKLNDINLEMNLVRCMGKGSKERIIPIGDMATKALTEYIDIYRPTLLKGRLTDDLFLNNHSTKITRQGFFKVLKQMAKKQEINKDFSPHT